MFSAPEWIHGIVVEPVEKRLYLTYANNLTMVNTDGSVETIIASTGFPLGLAVDFKKR